MNILKLFNSGKPPQTKDLIIDLRRFLCGHTKLGQAPDERDFFSASLKQSETYSLDREGFEVGIQHGALDYIFITVGSFGGHFAWNGSVVALDHSTSRESIVSKFGHPYWVDENDDDLLHFYEFEAGNIELQFEFIDRKKLGFITLMKNGVLSDHKQRNHYGVTKPWPP
jgi:hypothetical protein